MQVYLKKETHHPCNDEEDDGEDDDPGGDETVNAEAEADAKVAQPASTSRNCALILLCDLLLLLWWRIVPVGRKSHPLGADTRAAVFTPAADAISCENGEFPPSSFRKTFSSFLQGE